MSGDEMLVTVVSAVAAGLAWITWYIIPRQIRTFRRSDAGRRLLDVAPLLSAAVLFAVLKIASADDVRDDLRYLALYFVLGAAWVGASVRGLPLVGVSARDDVVERSNGSASYVVTGAMLALTLCFAGGNIGNGPGWWVVIFSAALATIALFVAWLLLEALTRISEVVTVDRDKAAGWRLAGFLVCCGLIFGRAVAGDWVSAEATMRDFFLQAWIVVVLIPVVALVERAARPSRERPEPSPFTFGIVPALSYIAIALTHVITLGLPE